MAVLSSAANGGSVQKVASLKWSEETIEVETCGRSYWSFLQRTRAIDNKQLGNVSAFAVDVEVDEEVGGSMVEARDRRRIGRCRLDVEVVVVVNSGDEQAVRDAIACVVIARVIRKTWCGHAHTRPNKPSVCGVYVSGHRVEVVV